MSVKSQQHRNHKAIVHQALVGRPTLIGHVIGVLVGAYLAFAEAKRAAAAKRAAHRRFVLSTPVETLAELELIRAR